MNNRVVLVAGFSCLVLGLSAAEAQVQTQVRPRLVIRVPSLAERVAVADAVLTGKVEMIEEKTVTAASPFGGNTEYQLAVVKIEDGIGGVKGLTHVKVAFAVPPANPTGGPIIRPGGRGIQPPKLEKDQEVCLFANKHATESFFVLTHSYQIIDKKNPGFEKEVADVKKLSALLDNADASLKSKDSDERYRVAAMLVHRYRSPIGASTRTAAIDAEQSRLILKALAEADWNKTDDVLGGMLTPINLFNRLGDKEGWQPPTDGNKYQEEAKKWVKDHAESYRIQRIVAEKGSGK